MSSDRLNRRRFLSLLGSASAVGIAGCVNPPDAEEPSLNDGKLIDENSQDTNLQDDSPYAKTYHAVQDSVVQLRIVNDNGRDQTGSGFVFDETHLVTNQHVVNGADSVSIRYPSTGWRKADVVGTDVYSDLGVLSVDDQPDPADPLPFLNQEPAIGTEVMAIGNPYGLSGTASTGIVSGINRTVQTANNFSVPDVIQTDAAVNPGNSGGPMVDLHGRVVGIISAGGGDNIGLAISSELASKVIPTLISSGSYDHPYLGIHLVNVTHEIATQNDLPQATGVYVTNVIDSSPAEGILQGGTDGDVNLSQTIPAGGDVITHIEGEPTPTKQVLSSVLALETDPGKLADVRVFRDGRVKTLKVRIGSRPEP